jgi:hypothetical protein
MRHNYFFLRFKNSIALAAALGLWLAVSGDGQAQTQFYNFDFEMASNLPPPSPSGFFFSVPATNALPGWTASVATNATSSVHYDFIAIGSANIALIDSNAASFGYFPADGNFSAVLQAGDAVNPVTGRFQEVPVTISQTGQIPGTAQSLRFIAGATPGALFVTFNGQNVPLFQLSAGSYAGDISAYAGQIGELSFGAQPVLNNSDPKGVPYLTDTLVILDDITFSIEPVPEPGTIALILCGAVLMGFNRRGKQGLPPGRRQPSLRAEPLS